MKQAIGFIEIRSLTGAIEAADAMTKAANVKIADFKVVGSGLCSVMVTGDVAAVTAAVSAGRSSSEGLGEVISANVIARPHGELDKVIELGDE